MIEVKVARAAVNLSALHESLSVAFGPRFVGVSWDGTTVRAHVLDSLDAAARDAVRELVAAHDPAAISAVQAAQQAREKALAALRGKPWAKWTAAEKDALLYTLAARGELIEG